MNAQEIQKFTLAYPQLSPHKTFDNFDDILGGSLYELEEKFANKILVSHTKKEFNFDTMACVDKDINCYTYLSLLYQKRKNLFNRVGDKDKIILFNQLQKLYKKHYFFFLINRIVNNDSETKYFYYFDRIYKKLGKSATILHAGDRFNFKHHKEALDTITKIFNNQLNIILDNEAIEYEKKESQNDNIDLAKLSIYSMIGRFLIDVPQDYKKGLNFHGLIRKFIDDGADPKHDKTFSRFDKEFNLNRDKITQNKPNKKKTFERYSDVANFQLQFMQYLFRINTYIYSIKRISSLLGSDTRVEILRDPRNICISYEHKDNKGIYTVTFSEEKKYVYVSPDTDKATKSCYNHNVAILNQMEAFYLNKLEYMFILKLSTREKVNS